MKETFETQIIEEKDIVDVVVEEQNKECKSCKQESVKPSQLLMIVSSFYILFAAIYGTIKLVQNFLSIF
jgi:hypothetical protein